MYIYLFLCKKKIYIVSDMILDKLNIHNLHIFLLVGLLLALLLSLLVKLLGEVLHGLLELVLYILHYMQQQHYLPLHLAASLSVCIDPVRTIVFRRAGSSTMRIVSVDLSIVSIATGTRGGARSRSGSRTVAALRPVWSPSCPPPAR